MIRNRKLLYQIADYLQNPDKPVVFLWGPRQTGKSTILQSLRQRHPGAYFNFDDLVDRRMWIPSLQNVRSAVALRSPDKSSRFVFIDEVQNYPEATLAIKLLADSGEFIIFATGSSELRAKTHDFDSLVGRYKEFILFPLTLDEAAYFKTNKEEFFEQPTLAQQTYLSSFIEESMIYGGYPSVTLSDNKVEELKILTRDSVIKDIVNIYELKNADLVYDLLRLLSTQIGNLVNFTEISSSLQVSKPTVANYLSILTRNRIIYFLEPLRSNARRGYLERKKVYFYDLGIRNSLIEDFRALTVRTDIGAMFENLVVMGAYRQSLYRRNQNKLYFFREIAGRQKEVDLVIESLDGKRQGFEIKYSQGQVNNLPDLNIDNFHLVNQENASEFLV